VCACDMDMERFCHVHKEAPGFRPAPRERAASARIRRHQYFAMAPVRECETLPRVQGGTRLSPCPPASAPVQALARDVS
jgi:hypothetical protein